MLCHDLLTRPCWCMDQSAYICTDLPHACRHAQDLLQEQAASAAAASRAQAAEASLADTSRDVRDLQQVCFLAGESIPVLALQ